MDFLTPVVQLKCDSKTWFSVVPYDIIQGGHCTKQGQLLLDDKDLLST